MEWLIDRIKALLTITEAKAWNVLLKLHEYFDPKWSMLTASDVDDLICTTADMMGA